jgi:hypothetical protein
VKLFPEDPDFSIGEVGFDSKDLKGRPYDVLGRKPLAQKLTDLLERIDQSLVVALDGGWGSGKSHFLRLWAGAHRLELGGKAEVIYFDAFEHDYLDDPLVSLVSRLTAGKVEKTFGARALEKVKNAAFPLARFALRTAAAVATTGVTEAAGAIGDAAIQKVGKAAEDSIDQFWKAEAGRIAAMQAFRNALTDLTKPTQPDGPHRKIVFIIDELDRCRPDYALNLLEVIKHFLAVPNVHFVMGANLVALENSVRARYGSEIDAHLYLQKFIHLTIRFTDYQRQQPNAVWLRYFDHLIRDMKIESTIAVEAGKQLTLYALNHELSLRDCQRIASQLVLLPKGFGSDLWGYLRLGIMYVILKVVAPRLSEALRNGTAVFSDLEQKFSLAKHQENGSTHADSLHMLLQVALEENVDAAITERTRSAFSDWSSDVMTRVRLSTFFATDIDTFHLPDTPP